ELRVLPPCLWDAFGLTGSEVGSSFDIEHTSGRVHILHERREPRVDRRAANGIDRSARRAEPARTSIPAAANRPLERGPRRERARADRNAGRPAASTDLFSSTRPRRDGREHGSAIRPWRFADAAHVRGGAL